MATLAHTLTPAPIASPILSLVPAAVPTWADRADVRAIAGMINTCHAMSVELGNIAGRGGDLGSVHTIRAQLGGFSSKRELSTYSRQWNAVQEPTGPDTVIGALWDDLDGSRSAWIKARLADDGLADVWTRDGATNDECMAAHERERELEEETPTVADVVNASAENGK